MAEPLKIPEDMIDREASAALGGAVLSVRDMLILLGVSDEKLREIDYECQLRDEILQREPWRDQRRWHPCGENIGYFEGGFDWTGTEMQPIHDRHLTEQRSRQMKLGRKVDGRWLWEIQEWDGEKWTVTRHADDCECLKCCDGGDHVA